MTYRNSQDLTNQLVRIAYKIMDGEFSERDGESIRDIAHAIAGRSLRGSVPENDLMTSLDSLLTHEGVQWAVIGGLAVSVHGTPRDTIDLDVLVGAMPDASRVADPRRMEGFGFYRAKSSTGTVLVIDHRKSGYAELLLARDDLSRSALQSAQPQMLLGRQVPVVDPAHLIALKARAWTRSPDRAAKDRADIVSVWETSRPDLSPVLGLLDDAEIESLKTAIPDAFSDE